MAGAFLRLFLLTYLIFVLILAQVHYGLFTEWALATGGLHVIPEKAKHAWLALTIVSLWLIHLASIYFNIRTRYAAILGPLCIRPGSDPKTVQTRARGPGCPRREDCNVHRFSLNKI